jgi:hypothetical protein
MFNISWQCYCNFYVINNIYGIIILIKYNRIPESVMRVLVLVDKVVLG